MNTYLSPKVSIDHNLYVRDQYAYQSNYESGLRITVRCMCVSLCCAVLCVFLFSSAVSKKIKK